MEFTFITKLTTDGEKFTTRPEFGPVQPVLDESTGTHNHSTALQNVRLVGVNLDFDKTDLTQGVFIAPAAGGAWVRLTTYGPITQGQIYVLIPSGTTGAQKLRVVNAGGHEGFSGEISDA